MSGYIKGRRKQSGQARPITGNKTLDVLLRPPVIIILMLAAIYLVLYLGGRLVQGPTGISFDTLVLDALAIAMFAVLGYMSRQKMRGMTPYVSTIDAFLVLSFTPMLLDMAAYMGLYSKINLADPSMMAMVNVAGLALTAIFICLYAVITKEKLSNLFLQIGKPDGIKAGLLALLVCFVVLIVGAFFIYGVSLDVSKMLAPLALLVVFALASAGAEELSFRSLLLSRLVPLTGVKMSVVLQAGIYAVIQGLVLYALTGDLLSTAAGLFIGAAFGYYWGIETLKNKSIVGPWLFHMGIGMIIALPVFAAFLI